MVLERFKIWRAKTFSGSEAFCQSDHGALEPSSKSAHDLTQGIGPADAKAQAKAAKAEAAASKKETAAIARAQKQLLKRDSSSRRHNNLTPMKSLPAPSSQSAVSAAPSQAQPPAKVQQESAKSEPSLKQPSLQAKPPLQGILNGQTSGIPPQQGPSCMPQIVSSPSLRSQDARLQTGQPKKDLPAALPRQPVTQKQVDGLGGPQAVTQQAPQTARPPPDAQARKRIAIAAEALTTASAVTIPNIPKSESVLKLFEKVTEHNLLFEMLSKPARAAIFGSMAPTSATAGTAIITQGDEGARFYILERGTCDVLLRKEEWGPEPRQVLTYSPGSGFGELALLYSAPRAATVQATTDCQLWVMERAVYNAIKHTYTMQLAAEKRALVASMPMLSVLSPENREIVAEALELEEYEAGETIYKQGDVGDRFYLIREGMVVISRGADASLQVFDRLGIKAYFGERALIKADKRSADATADSYVACYTLRRQAFNKLLGPIEGVWKLEALRKVPILFNLPEAQLQELASRMKTMSVTKEDIIFKVDDPGATFYVIEDGTFLIYGKTGDELARVSKGSCFGELALLRQSVRAASVKALTDGTLLMLTREDFDSLLGSLADIRHMWRFEALQMVPALSGLSPAQRSQLCPAMRPVRVPAGQAILSCGKPATFYVVEAGTCSVLGDKGQEVAHLGPTMYMGESALLGMEPSRSTVMAVTMVDLLMLQRSDSVRILGPDFAQMAAQSSLSTAKRAFQLSYLTTVARLGAGAFGTVTLVKQGSKYYALKQMSKSQIVQMGLQEHVKREKQIMAECDCPFMVNLVASFKDASSLYMVLEAVMGGELFTYLQSRQRPLSEEHARFYAASVVLGLEYMQHRNIMWRDLKPENLLIDTRGYVKMADFGFAKKMLLGQKSYTLCGTPEYLAPELVTQSGHTRAADWWAVGVLIFEMVAGMPPFYHEDRVTMFKSICHVKYTTPSHFSKDLTDLVKKILVLNPAQRLGALKAGAADVKAHPWFSGFDWNAFAQRTMPAPYVPRVKSPEDASNFVEPPADSGKDALIAARYQSVGLFKDF